jgi:hypothetical protein
LRVDHIHTVEMYQQATLLIVGLLPHLRPGVVVCSFVSVFFFTEPN